MALGRNRGAVRRAGGAWGTRESQGQLGTLSTVRLDLNARVGRGWKPPILPRSALVGPRSLGPNLLRASRLSPRRWARPSTLDFERNRNEAISAAGVLPHDASRKATSCGSQNRLGLTGGFRRPEITSALT